jgi:ComF family protein
MAAKRYHAFRRNPEELSDAAGAHAQHNRGMQMRRVLMPAWQMFCQSLAGLEQAVMPRRCVFCGVIRAPGEPATCAGCDADLPRPEYQCPRCAQPLAAAVPDGVTCADCQVRPPPFISVVVPLLYEFPVDAAIKRYKFRRRLYYAPAFSELLRPAMGMLPDDIDALLPVPLHWIRHGIRGFNQAAEICRLLRKSTGLPVIHNVRRQRATPYQSGLSAQERRRNLRRAFVVRGTMRARHVLIVDDVMTTGETSRQLAEVLREHGVNNVSVLAIARA